MNNSIDSKNRQLLDELLGAGVQIDFEIKPEFNNWAVQQRHRYIIVANNDELNRC